MFGELIGLWAVAYWRGLDAPERFRLVEVGPGDGTLMDDVLRAARLDPEFLGAAELVLVEPSRPLREIQSSRLADAPLEPRWVSGLEALDDELPIILIANEVLDCLPARQFVRTEEGWAERRVGLGEDGRLAFGLTPAAVEIALPASPGEVIEVSPAQAAFGRRLGELIGAAMGAALLIDYGRARPEPGDTLQALRRHEKVDPLERPGHADLTVWADFPTVLASALQGGADVTGVVEQGDFLRALGIEARTEALVSANPARENILRRQLARLVDEGEMGALFKAAAVFAPKRLVPAGFGA
jgi:SAM-dependent MidA family methyltransferase